MKTKVAAVGVCDFCGEKFPAEVSPYTTKGKPRLYCSLECRQTANSRDGAPIRSRKTRERIERGEWENPSPFVRADATDQEREEARRKIGATMARKRLAEVQAGAWRNPAYAAAAREKLSRPRIHGDNPALHSALERLRRGCSIADLTPEEAEAHREYRRTLRVAHRSEVNAIARQRYHEKVARMKDFKEEDRE